MLHPFCIYLIQVYLCDVHLNNTSHLLSSFFYLFHWLTMLQHYCHAIFFQRWTPYKVGYQETSQV